ncbi:hypothetical protein L0244_06510 [bacterium]|nr:hypothetical protein [bacterium]MCI0612624.1 hypothetical protein [bacterium]
MKNYLSGRERVAELADLLYKKGFVRSAREAYSFVGKEAKAGQCAWEMGEQKLAIHNWSLQPDGKETTDYLLQHKLFEVGYEILTELLTDRSENIRQEVLAEYEKLLTEWWRKDQNEKTANRIRGLMIRWPFHFSLPFYMEIMEFTKDYDAIYSAFELEKPLLGKKNWRNIYHFFLEQAKRLEKTGPARAGVRYLVIEHYKEANQCWRNVNVTDSNRNCMESAGLLEKLIEHYEANNDWIQAAFVYERMLDIKSAERCFLKANEPLFGADILASGRHYEAAYRLYVAAGEQLKAAKMLEKLKRFDEAAKLYEKIGDRASALRCAARVKRKPQQFKLS